MNKQYKIANKFRFTLFLTLLLLVTINMAGFLTGMFMSNSATEVPYKEVHVNSGDTLWSLINENGTSAETDTRKLVYEVCQLNHIDNKVIYPGQVIKIPIYN